MKANELVKEVEQSVKELASGTDKTRQSEAFRQYLDTMAKFWKYSFRNQILIHTALPQASYVAGFRAWKAMGRSVRKGSRAIQILAPWKSEDEEVTRFFPVNVFDISQTDGQPLPQVELEVDGDSYIDFLEGLKAFCAVKKIDVKFENLGVNGIFGYSKGGQVAISSGHSVNTQVNTLIHEIAHELLHREKGLSKREQEIQAEGTAYVVCRHFGLENKSFNYLALYNADYRKVMQNFEAISDASREIIGYLEGG